MHWQTGEDGTGQDRTGQEMLAVVMKKKNACIPLPCGVFDAVVRSKRGGCVTEEKRGLGLEMGLPALFPSSYNIDNLGQKVPVKM